MNVAQIKGFYNLKDLSAEDIAFIRSIAIERSPPHLRSLNARWIELFDMVFRIRALCEAAGLRSPEAEELFETAVSNLEEDLHGQIESQAIVYMDQILREDISFLGTEDGFLHFVHFACVQYFRTARIKYNVIAAADLRHRALTENTWNVLAHLFATNVSWTMFANRHRTRSILLKNTTSEELITGDQPVINTHAVGLNTESDIGDLEFYYPFSPSLALLITTSTTQPAGSTHLLSADEVRRYNDGIVDQSESQIYATSQEQLETIHRRTHDT